jgi:hypothetical protein
MPTKTGRRVPVSTLLILTSGSNNSFYKDDGTDPVGHPGPDDWAADRPNHVECGMGLRLRLEWSGTGPETEDQFARYHNGLIWDKGGTRFYVSGGGNNIVYPFKKVGSQFPMDAPFMVLNTGRQLDSTPADLAPYVAGLPGSSCQPPVDPNLIPECRQASSPRTSPHPSLHEGAWWANAIGNFNFKHPDDLDAAAFNRVLWRGMMGEETQYKVDRGKKP